LPALIFDLDGTLTDSKPGIVDCLRKVLDARGLPHQGPLGRFVGPPVEEWTVELLPAGSHEDRAALASDYRACYDREGWKNNSVFAGVREMLTGLYGQGFRLFVCTSKQQHFAIRILDLFGLTHLFAAIYGDKAEYPNHGKAELLARLLREQSIDKKSAVMIGDRSYDFQAARANGVRWVAAAWGYGSPEEFLRADAVAATPSDVFALVSNGRPRIADSISSGTVPD
jgi:phosphoglycolate phosphatase